MAGWFARASIGTVPILAPLACSTAGSSGRRATSGDFEESQAADGRGTEATIVHARQPIFTPGAESSVLEQGPRQLVRLLGT